MEAPFTPLAPVRGSPKESGEVGETVGDLLARHPDMSPIVEEVIETINRHAECMTPQVGRAVVRLLSAVLSPSPTRATKRDARIALLNISSEMLPSRLEQRRSKRLREQEALKAAAEAAAERERRQRARRQAASAEGRARGVLRRPERS